MMGDVERWLYLNFSALRVRHSASSFLGIWREKENEKTLGRIGAKLDKRKTLGAFYMEGFVG